MPSGEFGIDKIKDIGEFGKVGTIKFSRALGSVEQVGKIEQLTLGDTEQRDIANILGGTSDDYRLAGRILKLKERYPTASLPELVTMDWLNGSQEDYVFQAQLFGGRRLRGGVLPDFVLPRGGSASVWAIQGEYWHTKDGAREKDRATKLRTLGQLFGGLKITEYVEVWEGDVYDKRPMVFEHASAGLGLRG